MLLCALILGAFLWSHQTRSTGTLRAEYRNGTCLTDIRIDDVLFPDVLLDTGFANGTVLLGHNHAVRLGIAPVRYPTAYSSANGIGREAHVQIHELRLGSFVMRDLTIAVTQVDQDQVLLGLEILDRLHFRVSGHSCELGT
jgi:clan AA aspartic protease (TIGR02281 family)